MTFTTMTLTMVRRIGLLLALLVVGAVVPGARAEAAGPAYYQIVNLHTNEALALQQGRVVFVAPDRTRFDQQWAYTGGTRQTSFLLRNRAALDACLARPTTPGAEIDAAVVTGCAGTTDTRKRWYHSIGCCLEGPQVLGLVNIQSSQQLTPFSLCLNVPCGPTEAALFSPAFAQAMIQQGLSTGAFYYWVSQV